MRKTNYKAELAEIELYIAVADDDKLTNEAITAYMDMMERQHYNALNVGWRLKRIREALGLTQKDVAAALGVAYQTISVWECGKTDISLRDAYRLMSLYKRLDKGDSAVTMIYDSLDKLVQPYNA